MNKIHLLALHTNTTLHKRLRLVTLSSFWVQVDIPKGYSSERFLFHSEGSLFRKVLSRKVHYSEEFYPENMEKVIIPNFGTTTLRNIKLSP